MKKRFTEEQIIRLIKEYEGGKKAADIVREQGISEQTFYRWLLEMEPSKLQEQISTRLCRQYHVLAVVDEQERNRAL